MPKVPFNVDAYTARLIGRENVSKLNGAIIELVKNTYDADASICVLYYEENSNTLYIADNGCGMTEEIILKHWMTIGRSTKKAKYVSSSGRIQTGAKGIGRFALDRISDQCEMLTITKNHRWLWKVDWNAFSNSDNITDVEAELDETNIEITEFIQNTENVHVMDLLKDKILEKGTIFKLNLLHDEWNDSVLSKIKNDLATLIPYEMKNEFKVYLFDTKKTIDEAEVLNDSDAFSYDYKIDYNVSENGTTEIKIIRNEFDFQDRFYEIMKQAEFSEDDIKYFLGEPVVINSTFSNMLPKRKGVFENTIGQFSGVLYFAKVTAPREEIKKYYYKSSDITNSNRDIFSGIKIYRDSFRVRPYGEPNSSNYDWLLLSQRKNKSPAAISHPTGAWRVNSDQILGSISISRINITLPDQSNREGIVETKEFALLKEFTINVIQAFEKDRQYVFRKLNEYYDKKNQVAEIQAEINRKAEEARNKAANAKGNEDKKEELQNPEAFINVEKAKTALDKKDEVIKDLEDENRLLRTLATTGIVTNTYIHEIKDITHKLNRKIVLAKEALELDQDMERGLEHVKQANSMRESLNSWFKVTLGSVSRDKRTMKRTNIYNLVSVLVSTWREILKDVTINFNMENKDIEIRCFPYDIESIFSNLIANSIASFDANRVPETVINITIEEKDGDMVLDYSDSGYGLSAAYKKEPRKILDSMESDKRNELGETIGTGMGMWIISRTISDYNGSIDLTKNTQINTGFYITIKMKIRY